MSTNNKTINDLPIYEDERLASLQLQANQKIYVKIQREKNQLEKAITNVRESTFLFINKYNQEKENAYKFYESSRNQLSNQLDYLRQESVVLPKIVFISLSGFSGLLIGYRRSNFRKFLYSGLLSTTATALCFPHKAKELNNYAQQQANIVYRTYIWPNVPETVSDSQKQKVLTPKSEMKTNQVIIQGKDQIIKIEKQESDLKSTDETEIKGDTGMANTDDKDMYTTRGK